MNYVKDVKKGDSSVIESIEKVSCRTLVSLSMPLWSTYKKMWGLQELATESKEIDISKNPPPFVE